jgi:hypothetical protein
MSELDGLAEEAENWFFEHPMATLEEVAGHFDIDIQTVKFWSKTRSWVQRRWQYVLDNVPEDVGQQAGKLRAVVFAKITGENIPPKAVADLVKAWIDLSVMESGSGGVDRDSLLYETD